jgi:nucleoid DNA-binding protein
MLSQTDLFTAIARRTGVEVSDVRLVMEGFIDVLGMAIAVGDDVTIQRLGRFKPRATRPCNIVAIHTGERTSYPSRKGITFAPCPQFKARLNDPKARPPRVQPRVPHRQSEVLSRQYKSGAPRAIATKPVFDGKSLHELLWHSRSTTNRVRLDLRAFSFETGFAYTTAWRAMRILIDDGKVTRVARDGRHVVYEVSDPYAPEPAPLGADGKPSICADESPILRWG